MSGNKPYSLPDTIVAREQKSLKAKGFFFVGGKYFENDQGIRQYKYGQMYVEVFVPKEITQPYPLILYHGGGQSGLCWMETADKEKGWVEAFLERGYVTFVVDVPARGRSAYHTEVDGPLARLTSQLCKTYFADNTGDWPTAKLHTQWPADKKVDDKGYDKNYDDLCSAMVNHVNVVRQQELVKEAGAALLERTGPAVLVTHSMSGPYGWIIADACPGKVKAIVSLEPSGPPFAGVSISKGKQRPYGIADIPLKYEPELQMPEWRKASGTIIPPKTEDTSSWLQSEPAGQLVNLKETQVLLITAEASYHSPFDHLTAAFLKQAGVQVDFTPLADQGIHGNGHMMMIEKNNEVIAEFIHQWVSKHV
jgi:pimeloyl-ACP methyl ester carboxylesterase